MSDAFFEALKNLQVQNPAELEYRLYYDVDTGNPLFYSSSDEPGTYIVVDRETYNIGNYHCVIKNNKIVNLNIVGAYRKLVPSDSGITTHPDNVMIISDTGKQWALKTYEN